ncbi:hypothetical protein PR048_027705 [Dryococelus australis]|uniref:Uncharacterized protein n=1 Tax=Dryococelus australis TaxID=614101 RepID=A0ABQ9GH95_9NEOP|nr:hypothetical protein PR048_027705 [Dryococelus australis]
MNASVKLDPKRERPRNVIARGNGSIPSKPPDDQQHSPRREWSKVSMDQRPNERAGVTVHPRQKSADKSHRPTRYSHPGVTAPGVEPASPKWEAKTTLTPYNTLHEQHYTDTNTTPTQTSNTRLTPHKTTTAVGPSVSGEDGGRLAAQPIGRILQHAIANPTQRSLAESRAASQRMRTPTPKEPPLRWGRGIIEDRLLASHIRVPGSISGVVATGFSQVGIVQDDAAVRQSFLGGLPVSPPLQSCAAPCSPRFTLIGSQDLDAKLQSPLKVSQRRVIDGKTARQFFSASRVEAMRELIRMSRSPLALLRFNRQFTVNKHPPQMSPLDFQFVGAKSRVSTSEVTRGPHIVAAQAVRPYNLCVTSLAVGNTSAIRECSGMCHNAWTYGGARTSPDVDDSGLDRNQDQQICDPGTSGASRLCHLWMCLLIVAYIGPAGMQGWSKREIPEKSRRPAAPSGTIATCENPGVCRPGIEPGSP